MTRKVLAKKSKPLKRTTAKKGPTKAKNKPPTEKQIKSIILKKLGSLPRKDKFDLHYWADYIELKCLVNKDGVFSKDDFLDDFTQRSKNLNEADVDSSSDQDDKSLNSLPEKDQSGIFIDNCYKILEARVSTFKEFYPFEIAKSRRAILLKKKITIKHKQYLFLLFSSTLNYTGSYQNALTSSFELFSLQVLKQLLPKEAEVHLFGSGTALAKRKYGGTLWQKIVKLSADLNEGLPKAKQTDFPNNSTGDAGLDLIGYLLHGDNQPHLVTFSGQAACTENWDIKQFTSSYEAWKNRISFSVRPLNFVFAPFSLRDAKGEWHRRSDIGDCVLLDRQRLLYHFKDQANYFKKLPSYKIIDTLLTIKESALN